MIRGISPTPTLGYSFSRACSGLIFRCPLLVAVPYLLTNSLCSSNIWHIQVFGKLEGTALTVKRSVSYEIKSCSYESPLLKGSQIISSEKRLRRPPGLPPSVRRRKPREGNDPPSINPVPHASPPAHMTPKTKTYRFGLKTTFCPPSSISKAFSCVPL